MGPSKRGPHKCRGISKGYRSSVVWVPKYCMIYSTHIAPQGLNTV